MEHPAREFHIDEDAARGGSTPHILRYILAISLALAIVALSLTWITGAALNSGDDNATPSSQSTPKGAGRPVLTP